MNNEQPTPPNPLETTAAERASVSPVTLAAAAVALTAAGVGSVMGMNALHTDSHSTSPTEQQVVQADSGLHTAEQRLDATLANKSVIESHKPSPTDTDVNIGTAIKFIKGVGQVDPVTDKPLTDIDKPVQITVDDNNMVDNKPAPSPSDTTDKPKKIIVDDSGMLPTQSTPSPTDSPTPVETPASTETPTATPDTTPSNDYETGQAETDVLAPETVAVMDQFKADILDPSKSRTYPTGLVEVNVGKGYAVIDKAALAYDPGSHLVFAAWENPNAPSDDVTVGILGNIYGNLRVLTTDGANEAGIAPTLETSTGAVHVEDNHFTDANGNTFGTQLAEEPAIYHSFQLTLDANGALAIGPEIPKGTGVIDPVPLPTDGSPVMK